MQQFKKTLSPEKFPLLLYLPSLVTDRKICAWMLKRYCCEPESEYDCFDSSLQPSEIEYTSSQGLVEAGVRVGECL